MIVPPSDHSGCHRFIVDMMAQLGVEITASTEPPLVAGPYEAHGYTCPHGTTYWVQPTGEQIAQWAKDGTS